MYSKKLRQKIEQIIKDQNLNCSADEFSYQVNWDYISQHQKLSTEFIEFFQNIVNWYHISIHQILSESFIEKFQDKVDWYPISKYQILSEPFIEKFQDKLDWDIISEYQKLSIPLIEKFQDKINWSLISEYQELSEEFIEKYQNVVDWKYISLRQKLSESFIKKFQNKIGWLYISKYQKLSEPFIEKFQDKVNLDCISEYQKLSKQFREKYDLTIPKNNWLYTPEDDKINYIKENTHYKLKTDNRGYYLELYKSVRSNYYSVYNFQYKYEVGKTYVSHCDYNLNEMYSFGLSSWSKAGAINYHTRGRLLKVKVYVKDIGAITFDQKVRSKKLTVLEEIFDF